ncbi:MAG: polymer-forming cytoskeletal protein [Gemmatimonadales bacterium]|nr:polymer-forming cytoskeletal protein [Gemmatimonadota bacterium]MDX2059334.1 polymer-forming cytoskeletal protein [Gemmatimonadales bacterium]
MAIWKDPAPVKKDIPAATPAAEPVLKKEPDHRIDAASVDLPKWNSGRTDAKESLIAADITIEGKIEGTGHVRIAGRFKGDVHVQGNLTIEPGATLTGAVRAQTVVVGGQLDGNIDAASRVELLESGVLNGDLKAGSLTVAAGSRMRGQVEFGWDDKAAKPRLVESGAAS